jgi:hypothetical protein
VECEIGYNGLSEAIREVSLNLNANKLSQINDDFQEAENVIDRIVELIKKATALHFNSPK